MARSTPLPSQPGGSDSAQGRRIAFVLSSLWLSGGVRYVIEIANRLVDRGYTVCMVTAGGSVDEEVRAEIRPEIEIIESDVRIASPDLTLLQKIRLAFSIAAKIPRSDLILSTQTPTTIPALLGKLRHRSRLAWLYQDYPEMFLDRPLEAWLARNALLWHEAAFVVSTHSREELLARADRPVTVARDGLSQADYFRPRPASERRSRADGVRRVLFLGDMRPRKGLFDFLSAMEFVSAEIPELELWIVSKDECRIETAVPFEFFFRPSREKLGELYATCDVFVSASWWESFGVPPLEAMASGAPVVMTDSRGGREYARAGLNCLVVPPRDPGALATAVLGVLRDPDLEARLRAAGPPTAAEFTWEASADSFEAGLIDLFRPTRNA